MAKVKIEYTGHQWDGDTLRRPGDSASVEDDVARQLVNAGAAVYATVADASKAGGDAEQAATKK